MVKLMKIYIFAFLVLFSYGCASTLGYREKPNDVKKMSEISVLIDVSVAKDILGLKDMVDVPENLDMGNDSAGKIAGKLKEAGYKTGKTEVASIGATFNGFTEYKVIYDPSERSVSSIKHKTSIPPFFIETAYDDNEKVRERLLELHKGLLKRDAESIKGSKSLGFISDGLLVVQEGGFVDSWGKKVLKGIYNFFIVIFSGGKADGDMKSEDGMWIRMYLIELKSGEVVWAGAEETSSSPTMPKMGKLAKKVMKRFPTKQ